MIINKVVEAQVRYVPAGLLTGGRQLVLRWCLVNLELFLLELQTIHRFSQSWRRAFSRLKVPTSAFTFKTLIGHYAKQALTPIGAFSVIVKTDGSFAALVFTPTVNAHS